LWRHHLKFHFSAILIFAALIGLILGLGSYTFIYGQGYAYFKDDPKACVNCHIMSDQYESWLKGSHKNVTTCNSCHTPEGLFAKYFNKAENGFSHSWKFTLHAYKDPIFIRQHNFNIAMNSCLKCHGTLMENTSHMKNLTEGRSCIQCHRNAGHSH